MLLDTLNRCIPNVIRRNALSYSYAKNIVGSGVITFIAAPVFAWVYYNLGFPQAAYTILTLGSVIVVAAFSLNIIPSLLLTRTIIVGAFTYCIIWLIYKLGGLLSPAAYWLTLPPLLAILYGGIRAGVFWGVFCIIAICWIYFSETTSLPFPSSPITNVLFLQTFSILGFTIVTISLACIFENGKVNGAQELYNSNRKLSLEKEKAEFLAEEANAANLVKSKFLTNISHEIRTPLNGILGMANLLFETPLTQEQLEHIQTIRVSGEALLTIIDDIIIFSTSESNTSLLEEIDFDVQAIINNTVAPLMEQIHRKNLKISTTIDPDVPTHLRGDGYRLCKILHNLMVNAIKFTDHGEVEIKTRVLEKDKDSVILHVSVQDTGIGVSPDIRNHLFQPFMQGDSSASRRYGGTGLGLVISKQLVESLGGKIGLEANAPQGSCFWFTVPLTVINVLTT